jgi:hypothetical protein
MTSITLHHVVIPSFCDMSFTNYYLRLALWHSRLPFVVYGPSTAVNIAFVSTHTTSMLLHTPVNFDVFSAPLSLIHSRLNAMATADNAPPAKRRKLDGDQPKEALAATEHQIKDSPHKGLDRSISPPLSRRRSPVAPSRALEPTWGFDDVPKETLTPKAVDPDAHQDEANASDSIRKRSADHVSSPFQLTNIQDLAPHQNVDAVRLKDILGDPMIKECWNFNFLFDIDFVM